MMIVAVRATIMMIASVMIDFIAGRRDVRPFKAPRRTSDKCFQKRN